MYIAFTSAQQIAEELLAAAPAGSPPLWVLCVADRHGEAIPDLLAALGQRGIRACGAIFPGLIHGATAPDSGLIAIPLPGDSVLACAELAPGRVGWRQEPPALSNGDAISAMLLVDCLSPNIAGLLEDIYDRYGPLLPQVGGGSGYHDLRPAPTVFAGDGLVPHGALFILTPRRATVQVRHGWQRVAGPFVASRASGNVIYEFNWEPAGSFYRSQVEAQDPSLAGHPVFPDLNSTYPICVGREGGEDVIRDPVAIGAGGEVKVLSDVRENSVMYLVHGDESTLIAAARQAVTDCGTPADVERCFVSDCYSRALMLGTGFTRELAAAAEALGRFTQAVPEGVQAFGEVAANGQQKVEFFNKTFVVALSHR